MVFWNRIACSSSCLLWYFHLYFLSLPLPSIFASQLYNFNSVPYFICILISYVCKYLQSCSFLFFFLLVLVVLLLILPKSCYLLLRCFGWHHWLDWRFSFLPSFIVHILILLVPCVVPIICSLNFFLLCCCDHWLLGNSVVCLEGIENIILFYCPKILSRCYGCVWVFSVFFVFLLVERIIILSKVSHVMTIKHYNLLSFLSLSLCTYIHTRPCKSSQIHCKDDDICSTFTIY